MEELRATASWTGGTRDRRKKGGLGWKREDGALEQGVGRIEEGPKENGWKMEE